MTHTKNVTLELNVAFIPSLSIEYKYKFRRGKESDVYSQNKHKTNTTELCKGYLFERKDLYFL